MCLDVCVNKIISGISFLYLLMVLMAVLNKLWRKYNMNKKKNKIRDPFSPSRCGWKRHLDKNLNKATQTLLELVFSISEELTSEHKWVRKAF